MRQRIFISYRRQDSGANALGIGQYLEHEFGRKNVFIDVDMRAGAKFPTVLEERLAECKVMLALIGPDWLNSQDEQGRRRLDDPEDWVRLEIACALKRDITVIPVRVNDAPLPLKSALPEDIRGLLDHQAASVTLAGFRHEMAGIVRDIRSIPSPRPWRRYGAAAAILVLVALFLGQTPILPKALESLRLLVSSQSNVETIQNGVWVSKPGEWVMFAADNNPVAYYFDPSTLKVIGDRITYTARNPVVPNNANGSPTTTLAQGAYQDERTVMDCKKSMATTTERTIYNSKSEIIFHYKLPEPDSDLRLSTPIAAGSILSAAQHLLCDDQLRTPLLSKQRLQSNNFTHLISTPNGDGETYYDSIKNISEGEYTKETLFITELHTEHGLQEFFVKGPVRGIAPGYRTFAEAVQLDCKSRKIVPSKFEYYDRENNLVYVAAPADVPPIAFNEGSPLDVLLYTACGRNFAGTYEGTNNATYKTGATGEQKILIDVTQSGQELKVSFQSPGGKGEGSGTLSGSRVEAIALHSTEKNCPGTYNGSLEFVGDTMKWSYKGEDCGGPMEGHGSATKTKS
jgi:TIR domain